MYEYPLLDSINTMDKELFEALKHDPLLHACYRNYKINYNPKPFDYKKFYVYLSYMALSANQKNSKTLLTNIERTINPPVVIKIDEGFYNKDTIERLLRKENRSYWQKLWDAIWGR